MQHFFSGIQQIGIGVSDVHEAFSWYRRHFGMDVPVFEEAAEAALMLPYTGGQPRSRHAILALNLQGGGGMEIWQYTSRVPEAIAFTPQLGDLGIFIGKIKCKNAQQSADFLRQKGAPVLSDPASRPDGCRHVYAADPWGNIFDLVEADDWFSKDQPYPTGGVYGAVIGVSDMDKSLPFYQELLGYDTLVFDHTDRFTDWNGLEGSQGRFRRVLLQHNEPRKGPFGRLLGYSEIELVQALDHSPRKLFENRFWGDLGFIHLCFDVTGMAALKPYCAQYGHPFTVDSSGSFDMGEAAGYFAYIEDPDGTLIEFVETHKIPLIKKIGWYLDLRKRKNPAKPLPGWMVRAMGMGRVK